MDSPNPRMIGKYQIVNVLGRGDLGDVLLAVDDLGRRVTIKGPFKMAHADGLARFMTKARACMLTHPNIAEVYEVGIEDGEFPFIATEFLEGESLDRLTRYGEPMSVLRALSIVEQICAGLDYAHRRNVIHGELMLSDILMQANGVIKIHNFDLMNLVPEVDIAPLLIGAMYHRAHECWNGERIDSRADIFAAGFALYQLLTGRFPTYGGRYDFYPIRSQSRSCLSDHIRNYPSALDEIMDRAMVYRRGDRYRTAAEFGDALREVIDDLELTETGPPRD